MVEKRQLHWVQLIISVLPAWGLCKLCRRVRRRRIQTNTDVIFPLTSIGNLSLVLKKFTGLIKTVIANVNLTTRIKTLT